MGDRDSHQGNAVVNPGVIPLSNAPEVPLAHVGGKARMLGLLKLAGFNVPDGVVVAPDAELESIDRHVSHLGVGPFAVRSSGFAEDGEEASLAGKYHSILEVDAGSIMASVREVRDFGRSVNGEAIPVLTQVMIEPVCAGVAFTADPVTGNRSITLVTGTRGLADRLLSGQVAGDEWKVEDGRAKPIRSPEGALGKSLVLRVAGVAQEIAREFGIPQDIEWAWDGEQLWVVQTRPITRLPEELSWDPPAPGIYQRSLRFGEWIPEPVTPLFESWLLSRMERGLHAYLYDHIGQVAPEPLHVVVNGWYYYSLNWLPLPGIAFRENFFNILRRLGKDWRNAAPMFPQTVGFAYQQYEDDWRNNVLPRYRRAVSRAEERVEDLSPFELLGLVDELAYEAGTYFGSIATVAGSAYKFESRLATFWNKNLKQKVGVSHMVVLQGFEFPQEIYETPRLETLDWVVPPMSPYSGPANIDELQKRRIRTTERAEEALAGSKRRLRKFRRLLAEAQNVVPVREEQLSLLSLAWPVMRRAVHRLGEVLTAFDAIDSVDEVFYLKYSEVVSLLEEPESMSAVVADRRQERASASKLAAPLWVGDVPWLVEFVFSYSNKVMGAVRSDEAIVSGVPASPGRATGPVRVVRDSSQFEGFQDGEILVAPLTAPAWTHLFDRAAAVVTDVGSALAHASIIAREYGIPAVVGCGDATARLANGQIVTVDGSTGNVEPAPIQMPAGGD